MAFLSWSKDTCADCAHCRIERWDGETFPCDRKVRTISRDNYANPCPDFARSGAFDKNGSYGYQDFYEKSGWPKVSKR